MQLAHQAAWRLRRRCLRRKLCGLHVPERLRFQLAAASAVRRLDLRQQLGGLGLCLELGEQRRGRAIVRVRGGRLEVLDNWPQLGNRAVCAAVEQRVEHHRLLRRSHCLLPSGLSLLLLVIRDLKGVWQQQKAQVKKKEGKKRGRLSGVGPAATFRGK